MLSSEAAIAITDYSDGVPLPVDQEDEDQVQIKLTPDGEWHRRAIGESPSVTACGKQGGYGVRDSSYVGPLCRACFSPYELEQETQPPMTESRRSRAHMRGTPR